MPPIIDVHTHLYPPSYLSLLRSRNTIPYLLDVPEASPRLIILPSDNPYHVPPHLRGRPLDTTFSSLTHKTSFMRTHNITTSILSLANPWLDFLTPDEGRGWAAKINNEMNAICSSHPPGLFYAFATLPLSSLPSDIIKEITRLPSLPHIKGVIFSTTALGHGLDDPALDPIYSTLEHQNTPIFLHPHYGLPSPETAYGPRASDYGHVLALSLGFPMETTIAFTRLYLSGVFDRFPHLKILIAHAGGTLPFLLGRIESCVQHERHFLRSPVGTGAGSRPKRSLKEVLRRNVWLDAVVYSSVGVKGAVEWVGRERVMFGTDHPFFPPLEEDGDALEGERGEDERKWVSASTNVEAVREAFGDDGEEAEMVLGGNAVDFFGLELESGKEEAGETAAFKRLSLEPGEKGKEGEGKGKGREIKEEGKRMGGTEREKEREREREEKEGVMDRAGMGWGY